MADRPPLAAVLLDVAGTLWPDQVSVDRRVRIDRLISAWPGLGDQQATGDDYRADFAGFGLADLVDVFVSSIDVGVRKPDPGMFMAALKVLDCRADRAVIVGNSERNDIEPGHRLGAHTIRVAIEEPAPACTAADAVATDLRQVEDLLQAWTDAGRL